MPEFPSSTVSRQAAELALALERVGSLLRRLESRRELSLTAISTLRTLQADGPHRLCDLAEREGVTQPAMTQLVTRLERDGLVERVAFSGDGRVVLVEVRADGIEALSRWRAARSERLCELLAELPDAEAREVAGVIPALNHLAELGQRKTTR